MALNDQANDEDRQRLLPYVTRLACADTAKVEYLRMIYIYEHTYHYQYGIPFDKGLEVLEEALAIGQKADPLGPDEVPTRMDAVRAEKPQPSTATPEPARSKPFFSKVKSWLTINDTEPAA